MVNAQDNTWPEADVEALKRYWDVDGLTASQIASKLGHTRNAVIGKARRLDLTSRKLDSHQRPNGNGGTMILRKRVWQDQPTPAKPGPTLPSVPIRRDPVAIVRPQPLLAPEPLRLPDDGRITLMQLSSRTCRWPIGDPGTEDFCFCGHTPRDGAPYCEYHARQAYVPARNPRMKEEAT